MSESGPDVSTGKALLIEPCGLVFADPGGQNFSFPCACRCFEAFQLPQHGTDGVGPFHPSFRCYTLPFKQEPQEVAWFDRLDFSAQAFDCVSMDAREQSTLAPLVLAE